MCAFDIVVLLILIGMTFRGGLSGIISQIASILSIIAGWYVSTRYFSIAMPYFAKWPEWQKPISILAIFIVSFLAVKIVSIFLQRFISLAHMKEFDRQMGALLGLVKGIVVCIVLTYIAVIASEKTKNAVVESESGKYITMVILKIEELLPEKFKVFLDENNIKYFSDIVKDTGLLEKSSLSKEIQSIKNKLRSTGAVSSAVESSNGTSGSANGNGTSEPSGATGTNLSGSSYAQKPAQSPETSAGSKSSWQSFWPFSSSSSEKTVQNTQNGQDAQNIQTPQNIQNAQNFSNDPNVLSASNGYNGDNAINTQSIQNGSNVQSAGYIATSPSYQNPQNNLDSLSIQNSVSSQIAPLSAANQRIAQAQSDPYGYDNQYMNSSSWRNGYNGNSSASALDLSDQVNRASQAVLNSSNAVEESLNIVDDMKRYSSANFTERTTTSPVSVAPSF